jgi:hypothetical protein
MELRSSQMEICVAMKGSNLIAGDVVDWLAVQGICQRVVYSI